MPATADAGVAVSTLRVDLAAIRIAQLLAGLALDPRHPRLAVVVNGITRDCGTRPTHQTTLARCPTCCAGCWPLTRR